MTGEYRFTRAQFGDETEIISLYRGLIGAPGCTWDDEYPDEELVASDIARGAQFALRDEQGVIVAAAAEADDDFSALRWTAQRSCVLARVGVLAQRRGEGLGTLLMRYIMSDARERGFDGIIMLVAKDNAAAQALYDKLGFARCGEAFMFGHDFYRYEMVF